ncbi:MAG: hypothetical protein A4S14_15565 [Proteobacteria bacterium SG_bin9]|nr:MAG: hypothetical protein A4S14_15565 [Proteobacteria bacterium SG_bin9]
MEFSFTTILTYLLGLNGVISICAYTPQIYKLITSTGRSEAVSIMSWLLWLWTGTVALCYAIFVLKDIPLIIVDTIGFIGVVAVLGLTIWNRYYRFPSLPKGVSTTAAKTYHLPQNA